MRKLIYIISIISLMLVLFLTACHKEEEAIWNPKFPKVQDMDEFRRSFQHNGEAFVTSSFDESVIKSAVIVKAQLLDAKVVEDGYVIYHFGVLDNIKNVENDSEIYLYEPTTEDGSLIYQVDGQYLLVLARSTDIYYEHPVYNNFGQMFIVLDGEKIKKATGRWGEDNLVNMYELTDYESFVKVVGTIREENTIIKDGYYNFKGRFVDSEDYLEVVKQASLIATVTFDKILYSNAVMQECEFTVVQRHKGNSKETIIATIPSFLELEVGKQYLMPLFFDANYTLASLTGLTEVSSDSYDTCLTLLKEYLEDQFAMDELAKIESQFLEEIEQYKVEIKPEENDDDLLGFSSSNIAKEIVTKNETYQDYYNINDDFVGWITIDDTIIDYPVAQGHDNSYYLKKDIYKNYSKYGTIALDYRCDVSRIERNTMVFGHNMKDVKMFNTLVKYKDREFFDSHKYITFNTLYDQMTWEVFSVYVVDGGYGYAISYPLRDDEAFEAYVDDIYARNMYETEVEITGDDKLLTLITCSYEFDNARTIVHARLVSSTPWE